MPVIGLSHTVPLSGLYPNDCISHVPPALAGAPEDGGRNSVPVCQLDSDIMETIRSAETEFLNVTPS